MDTLITIQSMTIWLVLAGALLLALAFISRHWIERFPPLLDNWLFWVAGALLLVGVLGLAAPYLVIFFGARPA